MAVMTARQTIPSLWNQDSPKLRQVRRRICSSVVAFCIELYGLRKVARIAEPQLGSPLVIMRSVFIYFKNTTFCKFKVYSVIIWYAYILQIDYQNKDTFITSYNYHFFWWKKHFGYTVLGNFKSIIQDY